MLLLSCLAALAYNAARYAFISATAPPAGGALGTVVGEAKLVLALLLAAALLGEAAAWTLRFVVGATLAVLGASRGGVACCLYAGAPSARPDGDDDCAAPRPDLWTHPCLPFTPRPATCLFSHARLRAAQALAAPVIKGVPELAPLLRPAAGGGGGSLAIALGLRGAAVSGDPEGGGGGAGEPLGRRPGPAV